MGNTYPIGDLTVTPAVDSGKIKFTLSGTNVGLLTTTKLIRAALLDGIDQWISTNDAQLVTNGVTVGNDPTDTFGGSDDRPGALPGNGGNKLDWNYSGLYVHTPTITTTSLTTDAITASIPYADVL